MHGTLLSELQRYVSTTWSDERWTAIRKRAGVADGEFDPLGDYPDAEFAALLRAAEETTETSSAELLYGFGSFLGPSLIKLYWGAVQPEWATLDLIEKTDDTIHRVVRINNPGSTPPYLTTRRIAEDCVEVIYTSHRRLCSLAKGIAAGVARFYKESIEIDDRSCMNRNDGECRFVVRVTGKAER